MQIANLISIGENTVVSNNKSLETTGKSEFKSVMDKSKVATEKKDKDDLSASKDKDDNISEQIQEVVKKIDSGDEDEITEEVLELLQILNIEVIDNKALPIIIELPEGEATITTENDILSTLQKDFNNNLTVTLTEELAVTNLNGELTEDNIDKVLMLLADKDGNKVSKEKFLEVINNSQTEVEESPSGIEMLTMVFKSEDIETVDNENDILMKMLLEDSDNVEVSENDNLIFNEIINNKTNYTNTLTEEIQPTTVNKESVSTDVVRNLNYMMKNNIEQLTVKVYPKELGEITIKLLSEDGIMKADIKAISKETYNLLNSNMEEIKKYLNNENIVIKEVNIELYKEDTTYFSGENFNGEFQEEHQEKDNSVLEDKKIHMNNEVTEEILKEVSQVNLLA